jgi:Family of unknown function (DUF6090)
MINFFRKIRYNLMEQNKTGKYLKYAIGEIVLVVIGILIALSINNWNNDRVNKQLERQYLSSFILDFKFESFGYENTIMNRFQTKIDGLLLAKKYAYGNYIIIDTLNFISKVGQGGIFSIGGNFDNGSTYQELISTSNFKLIKNDSIKKGIINYYRLRESVSKYSDNLRSDYARYNNSLKPYNPLDRNSIDSLDLKRMFKRLQSEEFIDLINQELTFAYSIRNRVEDLNLRVLELTQNLEEELAR